MQHTDIKEGKGPATSLFINEIERPKPTAAQALIRVKAFGLNRMDLLQREGQYPVPPQAPKTLGVEFSGIIEELASESESGFKKGDAVFGLAYGGAYAEYIVVSTHMLVHKPDELSFEECAGIPEVCSPLPCIPFSFRRQNTDLDSTTDMDHRPPSDVHGSRLQTQPINPLARRRLQRLNRRNTTLKSRLCIQNLRNHPFRRKEQIRRRKVGSHRRF